MEHYEILGLDLGVEQGNVVGQATGELGEDVSPILGFFLKELNRNKVLATTPEGANVYSLFLPPIPSKAAVRELKRKVLCRALHQAIPCSLTFSVTYRCQADCVHCSSAHHRDGRKTELTTEECFRVIDETLALGAVNIIFTGGEPLLRKDIFQLIRHVDKEKALCNMFTNGELLTDDVVDRLAEAGLHSALVSLDSPDPETHDRWRRIPGLFDQAVQGLERVLEKGLLAGISTYITKEGLVRGDHERMMELGRRIGVHELVFFDTLPSGRFRNNRHGLLSPEEKQQVLDFTDKYLYDAQYPGIISQAWINNPKGSGCFAAKEQFYVTAYGDVCPCDFTPLTFGNVREASIKQLWEAMLCHEEYGQKRSNCRLQDAEFQRRYLDPIPQDATLPFPVTSG